MKNKLCELHVHPSDSSGAEVGMGQMFFTQMAVKV